VKAATGLAIVLVTAPDAKTARRIARQALEARLIACANVIPRIESHYRWQGGIESANEVLLILKTGRVQLKALEKMVLKNHPYDTPEFVIIPVNGGNKRYLAWWKSSIE
jgi:periplasmic divalent cation tolerance protein